MITPSFRPDDLDPSDEILTLMHSDLLKAQDVCTRGGEVTCSKGRETHHSIHHRLRSSFTEGSNGLSWGVYKVKLSKNEPPMSRQRDLEGYNFRRL